MAARVAPAAEEAMARSSFTRISPTKVRQVVDLIRGHHVEDARRILKFTQRGACAPVAKVLDSAIANAEHNRGLDRDELVVVRAWVDEGPTLRRFRPRALGRATRVRKRTCHVSLVVGRVEPPLSSDPPEQAQTSRRRRRAAGTDAAEAQSPREGRRSAPENEGDR
ncbi:MAG: 50S ribosomal protein L22 [Actinobacteria bacterium]|nr:50S ribosomal protein L22 [Actinomycetota bacterium]